MWVYEYLCSRCWISLLLLVHCIDASLTTLGSRKHIEVANVCGLILVVSVQAQCLGGKVGWIGRTSCLNHLHAPPPPPPGPSAWPAVLPAP